jgi:hypothetical protein
MRFPRVKPNTHSFYQCSSRVVDGRFIFNVSGGRCPEAEILIDLMRREGFHRGPRPGVRGDVKPLPSAL